MQLRQKQEQLQELGVQILALAPDKPELLAPLAKTLKLPFPLLGDPLRTVYEQYSLLDNKKVFGANFVLDAAGVVQYAHRGVTPEDRPPLKELVEAGKAATVNDNGE